MKDIVIPAAGRGKRLRSILGSVHKELAPLPYGYRLIDFSIQEAVLAGAEHIVIIISIEKEELRRYINEKYSNYNNFVDITFIYQRKPRGLGDAVLTASEYVSDVFGVILPDEIILFDKPAIHVLYKNAFMSTTNDISASILLRRVDNPRRYGVARIAEYRNGLYIVNSIIEKPQRSYSNYAIIGRYVLNEQVFDYLSDMQPNPRTGEIELSDALGEMAKDGVVLGMELPHDAIRFDCGTPEGYTRLLRFLRSSERKVSELWARL